jgi:hypothetical protein
MSRIRVIIRLKRRLALALLLSSLAINGAVAGSNLSRCLDPATTLDAGGDVSDKELTTARQACAHLRQQSGLDAGTRLRVDHAASTLGDEQQHRQASHH